MRSLLASLICSLALAVPLCGVAQGIPENFTQRRSEFEVLSATPVCASGKYFVFAASGELKLKKCENGTITDLDTTGGADHNLLSTTHTDTTAGTVARGDLVVGQSATPTWQRLSLGSSGKVIRSDGTDALWTVLAFGDLSGSLLSGQDYAVGTAGAYTKLTTNAQGRISSATSVAHAGTGSCAANNFATATNDEAAPTCTQPAVADLSDTKTGSGNLVLATSPTLTTPTVADLSNMTHTHQSNAGGGTVDVAAIASGILTSVRGGTGNGFTKFSGPAAAEKIFTLPNASAAVLTDNAAVTPAQGGTGQNTTATSGGYLKGDGTNWGTSSGAASGTGTCGANSWASTLNSDAAPTCTQPSSSNLSDSSNIALLNAIQTFIATNTFRKANIATTATDSLVNDNNTAATSGVPVQYSPAVHWTGHAWDTGTSADKAHDWHEFILPTSANPTTSILTWRFSLGGAAFTEKAELTSGGIFSAAAGYQVNATGATSGKYLKSDGTKYIDSSGSASGTGACAANNWASTLNSDAAPTCTQPAATNLSDNSTLVKNNAGNTWSTGSQDMGSATSLKVPTSAGAGPTANGLIAYDSTANQYKGGVNTVANFIVQAAAALTSSQLVQGSGNGAVAASGVTVATAGSGGVTAFNQGTATTLSRSDHQHFPATVQSTSAVTVSANTTNDQNLISLSLPAGVLNSSGRVMRVVGSGTYSTGASGAGTTTYKVKLCTVSGCGSGTVVTLVTMGPTAAESSSATSMPWYIELVTDTTTTGATGNIFPSSWLKIVLGATATAAGAVHVAQVTANSGNIDLTAALFLQFVVAYGSSSANNSSTQRIAFLHFGN